MGQRVGLGSKLKPGGGGAAKASPKRAFAPAQAGAQLPGSDPKPGDLAMARVKVR